MELGLFLPSNLRLMFLEKLESNNPKPKNLCRVPNVDYLFIFSTPKYLKNQSILHLFELLVTSKFLFEKFTI